MANKSRALTLDLVNNDLKRSDSSRGYQMRVVYTPFMFARCYRVIAHNYGGGLVVDLRFRFLSDAVDTARAINLMSEKTFAQGRSRD